MADLEKRYLNVEVRSESDDSRTVRGYAAVYNQETVIGDYFREKIASGAFARSLSENDIRACWNHNMDLPIGRSTNGSLRLREDDRGLAFELDLPDTNTGRDAYELIRTGVVSGVSFGFSVRKETWEQGENGELSLRILEDVDLYEISPCTFPAYEQTNVVARSVQEALKQKEIEWAYNNKPEDDELEKEDTSELDEIKRQLELVETKNRLVDAE